MRNGRRAITQPELLQSAAVVRSSSCLLSPKPIPHSLDLVATITLPLWSFPWAKFHFYVCFICSCGQPAHVYRSCLLTTTVIFWYYQIFSPLGVGSGYLSGFGALRWISLWRKRNHLSLSKCALAVVEMHIKGQWGAAPPGCPPVGIRPRRWVSDPFCPHGFTCCPGFSPANVAVVGILAWHRGRRLWGQTH